MGIPLFLFFILLYLGWEQLGLKGALVCLVTVTGLFFGCFFLGFSPYVFIALLALTDVVLLLSLFGGDIRIR